jgi:hypothetical protein
MHRSATFQRRQGGMAAPDQIAGGVRAMACRIALGLRGALTTGKGGGGTFGAAEVAGRPVTEGLARPAEAPRLAATVASLGGGTLARGKPIGAAGPKRAREAFASTRAILAAETGPPVRALTPLDATTGPERALTPLPRALTPLARALPGAFRGAGPQAWPIRGTIGRAPGALPGTLPGALPPFLPAAAGAGGTEAAGARPGAAASGAATGTGTTPLRPRVEATIGWGTHWV